MKEYISVGILMPIYNEARHLDNNISKILNQSHLSWNLFIQDNCSTDKSLAIAKKWAKLDPRIQIRHQDSHDTWDVNWNSLCDYVTTISDFDYLMWHSGDDWWQEDEYLSTLVQAAEQGKGNDIKIVVANFTDLHLRTDRAFPLFFDLSQQRIGSRIWSLCGNWVSVHAIYGLYETATFLQIATKSRSRLTSYLGSDWWWVFQAIIISPVKKVDSVNYIKSRRDLLVDHQPVDQESNITERFKFGVHAHLNSLVAEVRFLGAHFNRRLLALDLWVLIPLFYFVTIAIRNLLRKNARVIVRLLKFQP
jgi:glycosyltransferase involved in cell wall biosynthesis